MRYFLTSLEASEVLGIIDDLACPCGLTGLQASESTEVVALWFPYVLNVLEASVLPEMIALVVFTIDADRSGGS